jgi:DNA-binding transcriptional regulator YdaS (Cro superfamily)
MATTNDTEQAPAAVSEAIDSLGGDSAVARLLDVRPWAISKWRKKLPPNRVLWLAEKTKWKFTPHELSPSMYPNPTDGLPADRSSSDAADDTQNPTGGESERGIKEAPMADFVAV